MARFWSPRCAGGDLLLTSPNDVTFDDEHDHEEANAVHGTIHMAYMTDFPAGPLGFPITDEQNDLPGCRTSHFEGGRLRFEVAGGTVDRLVPGPPPAVHPVF